MLLTIETVHSVITPDAGHCSTILISEEKLEAPYKDKSVAISWDTDGNTVVVNYAEGERLIIPLANVRFIHRTKQIETKKEPHKVNPVFLKKK